MVDEKWQIKVVYFLKTLFITQKPVFLKNNNTTLIISAGKKALKINVVYQQCSPVKNCKQTFI